MGSITVFFYLSFFPLHYNQAKHTNRPKHRLLVKSQSSVWFTL